MKEKPMYDMLWKGMIEVIMSDLLLFVDPEIGKEVDLDRGFEFLDKELAEIFPEPEKTNLKAVDNLVKVFLREGGERWILLHVEVQGRHGKDFPARMFEYFMRIRKHGRPIAAIAIVTSGKGHLSHGVYRDRCLWTNLTYEYKTLCIEDYSDEMLAASPNPFASAMLIAKEALLDAETDDGLDSLLLEQKLLMFNLLKGKVAVFGEAKTRALLYFLYNYVVFNKPETKRKFISESEKLSGKNNITMGIIEQVHEIQRKEGRELGLQEGRQQGRQQGRQEGLQEGLQEGRQEGLQEGLKKGLETAVERLLTNTSFSDQEIVTILGVNVSIVETVRNRLNRK